MNVAVTGTSGFIGPALVANLRADGHRVLRLVRRDPRADDERRWDPSRGQIDQAAIDDSDAVVHLAGVGIGDRRWSERHKEAVLSSRVDGTSTIARALAATSDRPRVLLSASGVGYYGATGDEAADETAPKGTGFAADVVRAWEDATAPAVAAGVRVVVMRTGVVLGPGGGALGKMLPLFKLGLGGRLGSGKQWMSWIALPDYLAAVRFLLGRADVAGVVNVTSPEPVRNRDYTKALARAVHRPAVAVVPPFALRLVFGGFADEGILISQRVVPTRLEAAGFTFTYDEINSALNALLG